MGVTRAIYRSLFVQAKGALKHELTGYLRTKRVMRRPQGMNKYRAATRGKLREVGQDPRPPCRRRRSGGAGPLGGGSGPWCARLRRSLTCDQGEEMARHVQSTVDTGVAIYFCDPNSPWQCGSNENTNGLLRQHLPKRSDLRPHSQSDLDAIGAELNERSRHTLGFMTPSEKYAESVALTV